ncbi:MAG: response regulator transcription factor [Bacteroidota bacterium]|nr:response regulator transcription factor [Bacteroidota bacterium]
MKVLVVEDERELSESICQYLEGEDFLCEKAYEYHQANQQIHLNDYVCIILDITLANGSGLDLLMELKKMGKADGVIIISAKNSLDDKLRGLQLGADDYLAKPFHLAELAARVTAIIRRRSFEGKNQITLDGLVLDLSNKTLQAQDQAVALTKKEYDLLLYFISNRNRVVTKESIVEHLWGSSIEMSDSYDFIYAHIKNLRKKLLAAGCPDYIRVAYGMGYKFTYEG